MNKSRSAITTDRDLTCIKGSVERCMRRTQLTCQQLIMYTTRCVDVRTGVLEPWPED